MQARPVLMLTHDEHLWQHWRRVPATHWLPASGRTWEDLSRWRARGQRLALVDTGLPGLPALDSDAWREGVAGLDLLVCSLKPTDEQGRRFLAAGAKGYVHAYMPPESLDTALKTLAAGGVWMGASLLARLLQQLDQAVPAPALAQASAWSASLTPRETEVAERAARGMANQSIADELGITERTVRAHISAVFEKLGVSDRLMLALLVHGISI